MPTDFPTDLDTLTNPAQTDLQTSPNHAGQHSDANDAIEALEAKVGIDGSAVATSIDARIGLLDILNEEVVQPWIHVPLPLSKFAHVEQHHGQVQAPIADLGTSGTSTIAQIEAKINAILAAQRSSGVILS